MAITSWAAGFREGSKERRLAEAVEQLDSAEAEAALQQGAGVNAKEPKSGC